MSNYFPTFREMNVKSFNLLLYLVAFIVLLLSAFGFYGAGYVSNYMGSLCCMYELSKKFKTTLLVMEVNYSVLGKTEERT